jgi:HlyD family secretion protein
MNAPRVLLLASGLALASACASGCGTRAAGGPEARDEDHRAVVQTVTPTRTALPRTTTQPATVHAWYEARVFAKVSGYVTELKADIGKEVTKDDLLAVLDVPELAIQQKAKQATVKRLEADEQRAARELAVARAREEAARAKRDEARAQVNKADATLTASRIDLQRAEDLVRQRAVADRVLDEAKKKYEAAEAEKTAVEAAVRSAEADLTVRAAEIEAAQAEIRAAGAATDVARRESDELDEMMKYARLKAPFAGVVIERNVDLGDLVRNTQTGSGKEGPPLFVIAQLDTVRVRVPVPERDAPLATVGDKARVTLQALPGDVFEGEVSRVAHVLDPKTRTMLVEIDLKNPKGKLLPGMFGQATITLEPARKRLALPSGAVRYDEQGKSYVYVLDADDTVKVVEVRTGLDDGERIEITAGLDGKERIVGPLVRRLKAGDKVRVEN